MDEPSAGSAAPVAPGRVSPAVALGVAVLAISWAGPLVRFTTAPAVAVAAWRLLLSVAFIAAVLLIRRTPPPRLHARDWLTAATAGIFLAAHFWSWIGSLELTTVSSSVVLVSTQPVFVALLSGALLGEAATRRQWAGIMVAVSGAVVIAWGDFGRGSDAVTGDLLAIAGAIFVSIYYVAGRRLRPLVDLWWYTGIVYGTAALVLLLVIAAMPSVPLVGYSRADWLVFVALAAGPMMLGHTAINYALRHVRAYVANLVVLAEPVGATLIAWALPGIAEVPGWQTLLGGVLILGGIALTLRRRGEPAAATRGGGERPAGA